MSPVPAFCGWSSPMQETETLLITRIGSMHSSDNPLVSFERTLNNFKGASMRKSGQQHRSILEQLEPRQLMAVDFTSYLSDRTPAITPVNGWGPIQLDKSNGENG